MANRSDRRRRVARGLCLVFWVGVACAPAPAHGAGPDAIPWRTDLRRAQAEARALGRPLWVQFTGSWCPNCVRLERESFAHPRIVGKARDRFIPVRIVLDDHEDMADRFGLTGIPATIVLSPSGDVVARREGYVNTAAFHAFLDDALLRAEGTPPIPAPVRPVAAAAEMPLGMAGFCPVSLVDEHRLVIGRRTLGLSHEGRIYWFASMRAREAFRQQPGRYVPANGGRCPVAQVDRGEALPGEARWSVLYRDRLFLCADEDGRSRFRRDPERYFRVAVADFRLSPPCAGRGDLLARDAPEPSPYSSSAPGTECRRTHPLDPVPLDAGLPGVDALRR